MTRVYSVQELAFLPTPKLQQLARLSFRSAYRPFLIATIARRQSNRSILHAKLNSLSPHELGMLARMLSDGAVDFGEKAVDNQKPIMIKIVKSLMTKRVDTLSVGTRAEIQRLLDKAKKEPCSANTPLSPMVLWKYRPTSFFAAAIVVPKRGSTLPMIDNKNVTTMISIPTTKSGSTIDEFFTRESIPVRYKRYRVRNDDHYSLPIDINGYTKNLLWVREQTRYQRMLPFAEQIMILNYTYGGDAVLHAAVLDVQKLREFQRSSTFLHPLLGIWMILYRERQHYTNLFQGDAGMMIPRSLITALGVFHDSPSIHAYDQLLSEFRGLEDESVWRRVVKEFGDRMERLIRSAPPLVNDLWVYRGVATSKYLDFNKDRLLTQKNRFTSVSLDPSTPLWTFTDLESHCCLLRILLLKGQKLLLPVFTYFEEFELILPRNTVFYSTSPSFYTPKETGVQTMNVVVVK